MSALLKDQFIKYRDEGYSTTRRILKQSIDFLQETEKPYRASNELIKQIGYSMQHIQFCKDEVIIYENQSLRGIYLIRSGIVNITTQSSLFQSFNM